MNDSVLPTREPEHRFQQGVAGLRKVIANPAVQWLIFVLAAIILLSITSSGVAEAPYNRF